MLLQGAHAGNSWCSRCHSLEADNQQLWGENQHLRGQISALLAVFHSPVGAQTAMSAPFGGVRLGMPYQMATFRPDVASAPLNQYGANFQDNSAPVRIGQSGQGNFGGLGALSISVAQSIAF